MELELAEDTEDPLLFVATTVKVYAVPDWSPTMAIGLPPLPVYPPLDAVAA
jgi:hypothetical protein